MTKKLGSFFGIFFLTLLISFYEHAAAQSAPPAISIASSPSSGLVTPATVTLTAGTYDSDGWVAQVDYYYDNWNYLGSAYSPPFALTVGPIVAGTFSVFGRATDNSGTTSVSQPISVTVNSQPPPPPPNSPPIIAIAASPSSGLVAPATVTLTAYAYDYDGWVIQVDYYYDNWNYLGSAYSPPFSLTVGPVVAGTFSVFGRATDNGLASAVSQPISVTVNSSPPAVQPSVVHATQLTAACADKYCIKITGFQFASNAYVELRRDSANGPIVGQEMNPARGTSGDANTLEVTITDPSLRTLLANEPGLWVYVVNPGNPSARAGGFNVVRDNGYSIKGQVETVDSVRVTGWVCSDLGYNYALNLKVRLDSDQGTTYVSAIANIPRPDLISLGVCGGTGAHGFDVQWPGSWKTSQTRDVYVVADLTYLASRYPNALLNGAPRRVTFQSVPFGSAFVSQNIEPMMVAGSFYPVTISMRNVGNYMWSSTGGSAVSLGSQNPQNNTLWGTSRVSLAQNVSPDSGTTFNFSVLAPATDGLYNFQWQLLTGTSGWFGETTPNLQIRVRTPPTVYPAFTFPSTF